jgi:hypothetical protein
MTSRIIIREKLITFIAKIKASLAELTEETEGKILFACPEEFPGQTKRLFWRIGLSPILQKNTLSQRPLWLERVLP